MAAATAALDFLGARGLSVFSTATGAAASVMNEAAEEASPAPAYLLRFLRRGSTCRCFSSAVGTVESEKSAFHSQLRTLKLNRRILSVVSWGSTHCFLHSRFCCRHPRP
ncbi:hypothetical protein Vafri_9615 [Volvox africanus]|uniref:Uncharacterized protein n=1 Tax=Volvox africanus TaxID=51714 RepID=A0A8J4F2P3_9CHLO|nr:hypothetical protein Vafri_9615 [Volvox africanus]